MNCTYGLVWLKELKAPIASYNGHVDCGWAAEPLGILFVYFSPSNTFLLVTSTSASLQGNLFWKTRVRSHPTSNWTTEGILTAVESLCNFWERIRLDVLVFVLREADVENAREPVDQEDQPLFPVMCPQESSHWCSFKWHLHCITMFMKREIIIIIMYFTCIAPFP